MRQVVVLRSRIGLIAVCLVVGLLVGAAVMGAVLSGRMDDLRARATAAELRAQGWTEGRTRKPPPPAVEAPDGAERVASARIRVEERPREDRRPQPRPAVAPGQGDRDTQPPREDRMPPRPDRFPCPGGEALPLSCDVQPGDLSADLSIDVVRAGDRPFGVVVGEIRARLPDGSRVIRVLPAPETEEDARRIGQELDLWVAPSAVQLPRRLAFVPRRIRHWRFGWSAGAGLCHDALNRTAPCVSVTWGVQF